MLVECPACHVRFKVKAGDGRPSKAVNLPLIKGTLSRTKNINKTIAALHIGRDRFYQLCKGWNLDPKSITGRKYTKKEKKENGHNGND